MTNADGPILIYTTFETGDDARRVGRSLVEAGLAACANILAPMTAIYRWQGAIEEAGEVAMIIKSRRACQDALLAAAKELHPYDTPALIVIDPATVDEDFARWITDQTQMAGDPGGRGGARE